MILTRSFHRTRHSPCAALVLIAHPVVPVFVQVVAGIVAPVAAEAAVMTVRDVLVLVAEDAMVPAQVDVLLLAVALVGVTDVRVTVQLLAAWTAAVVLGVVLDVVGAVQAVAIGPELPMAKINYLFSLDFAVDFHKVVTTMYPVLKEEEYDGYKHCRCYY